MAGPRYGSPLKRAVTFYIPLTVMVGATLFPFYWMVITSVRPDVELFNVKMNPFFTLHPTLNHFYYLFELTMFPRLAWNTLFIAVVSTAISLFCGLLAGYALASRPQKREMAVETTAMKRVFHANRGNMVSSNR